MSKFYDLLQEISEVSKTIDNSLVAIENKLVQSADGVDVLKIIKIKSAIKKTNQIRRENLMNIHNISRAKRLVELMDKVESEQWHMVSVEGGKTAGDVSYKKIEQNIELDKATNYLLGKGYKKAKVELTYYSPPFAKDPEHLVHEIRFEKGRNQVTIHAKKHKERIYWDHYDKYGPMMGNGISAEALEYHLNKNEVE